MSKNKNGQYIVGIVCVLPPTGWAATHQPMTPADRGKKRKQKPVNIVSAPDFVRRHQVWVKPSIIHRLSDPTTDNNLVM